MGDKIYDVDDKMSNACIFDANKMAKDLLNNEFKGAGDTIEAAAHRVQTKYSVKASLLLRLRYRFAEMTDMKASSWFSIFEAYQRALARAEKNYEHMRQENETNPRLVRVADFVAGRQAEKEEMK